MLPWAKSRIEALPVRDLRLRRIFNEIEVEEDQGPWPANLSRTNSFVATIQQTQHFFEPGENGGWVSKVTEQKMVYQLGCMFWSLG